MTLRFRTAEQRNFWFLYLEAFLSPFTGIAGAFAGAFAIRLGATNTEIGLMNSLPPLLVILVAIPFGHILQVSSKKLLWSLGGVSLYRIGYMLFALAPLASGLVLTPSRLFIGLFVLGAIPIQLFNIGNVGMMIAIIPEKQRATVISIRNILGTVVSIAGVFLAGQWLSHMTFPGNYQALFIVTGAVAFLSLFAWLSIRYPQEDGKIETHPPVEKPKHSFLDQAKELLHVFHDQPMFVRFTVDTLLMNIGLWIVSPLYVLYTVRQLGASDAWIGTSGMVASICSLLGWIVGRRLVDRWGDCITQRRFALAMGIYPILIGLSPTLTLILIFGGLYNLFTPGFTLGNYNTWLRVLPEAQREDATAVYYTILNVGPFIFPLVGVFLAERFGISATLIGCGLFALLGATSFSVWKIHLPSVPQAARES